MKTTHLEIAGAVALGGERTYRVTLEEGMDLDGSVVVAECPALPGCISQGRDEHEAILNISEAIVGWLTVERQKKEARPTPEMIDGIALNYEAAKAAKGAATEALERIEAEAIEMVSNFGIVPAHAEKSRRLSGKLAELTVTKSDTLTINDTRVDDLRDALNSSGHPSFFSKLFTERKKWEIVDGAESALKEVGLPKRLAEKVLSLFGRCISVKAKKPSLKVVIADPAKPAKKRA